MSTTIFVVSTHTHTHTLSLSLSHIHPHTFSHTLYSTFYFFISLSLSLSLSLTHTHTHTHVYIHTHIQPHTYTHRPQPTYTAILGSNYTLRGFRKRMIEIWQECAWFQTTNQRLADQVKERLVFWPWNTRTQETHNEKEQSNQNEPPISENRNTTQPNNTEQTLTQDQKRN